MRPCYLAVACASALLTASCATARPAAAPLPQPRLIPHAQWEAHPPLGHAAVANRRNLPLNGSFQLEGLTIELRSVSMPGAPAPDSVELLLRAGNAQETRRAAEGEAFNWQGYHIAIVAVPNQGELGHGLVSIEAGTLASLPAAVASSKVAGDASLRLRIPHEITHVTLHHLGSARPLRAEDDPAAQLRGLQTWGARDRNWWDVPYHFLIDLEGDIHEGRDWHYMGETNTAYDPRGHLLISIIGNYELQEPTPAQLDAIADMMAWGVSRFNVPLDRIGGHYDYAETSCPGKNLRRYLEDGTFRRMVEERLGRTGATGR